MSPRTKSNKTRSRNNKASKVKKEISTRTPVKTRSKLRSSLRTPKNEKKIESVSSPCSTADVSSSSLEENKWKEDVLVTPKVMKYCLNAYKESPDYDDLKQKRFNTSFCYENPRSYREIKIFTPEEENSPFWKENLPVVKSHLQGEPGEKYANIFMSMPDFNISYSDEDVKPEVVETEDNGAAKKRKKGRKKSVGYKGVPIPDECLLTDYSSLLHPS